MLRWESGVVAFLLASLAVLSGCIGLSGPVRFAVLDEGDQTGFKDNDTRLRVVTSHEQWQEFWRQHQEIRIPPESRPAVNFSNDFVVAVFLGQRPSAGYDVNVTQVVVEDGAYRVHYESMSPDGSCGTLAVVTHPYVIFTLSRESGDGTSVTLEFEGDKAYSCSESMGHGVIDDGGQTGFKDNETTLRVVTSDEEWQEFWRQHQQFRSEPATRPTVDFTSHFVVGVFLGQRYSGGHSLKITQVVAEDGEYRVQYHSVSPGEDCLAAAVIVHPYQIFTLSRESGVGTDVELEFEGDDAYACTESMAYAVIDDGYWTGFRDDEATHRVVTSEAEWEEFWRRHQGDRSEPAARPMVDFRSDFVAALFLGYRPSSGYDVNVTEVVIDDGDYRVHYESMSPDSSCGIGAIETHPYIIFTLPRVSHAGPWATPEFEGDKPYSC